MSGFRRRLGWILVVLSLLLHLFTVLCFARQPDIFAAFTVLPIWVWGGLGLLMSTVAFYFMRASLSLILTGVWALTLLVGSDEALALGHIGRPSPQPGAAAPYNSHKVIRVLTINAATFNFGDPSDDIAAWDPDIILMQQCMPQGVEMISKRVYGEAGDFRSHFTNGVATRWKIQREDRQNLMRSQQMEIRLPDGRQIEVVNLHLPTAATDLRFWKARAWKEHKDNRQLRRQEIATALQILDQTTNFPEIPTILGGDFNAPATDVVHRQLSRDFVDAFSEAGTGWGDTFHRRLPILRIDHIYSTRHLTPVRCRAVETRYSDHRFVVADFILR